MTLTTRTVDGASVLRGSAADVLAAMKAAGMLLEHLPVEQAAVLNVEPPVVVAPVEEVVVPPAETVPAKRAKPAKYTRPNGEEFFARKIKMGDFDTTDVEFVRAGIKAGLSMFFVGAPGCGKTACIEAALHDWEGSHGIETLMGSSSTEVSDFIGGFIPQPDGTFLWIDGPLLRAMREGKVIYVDEIGRIDPKVLTGALYSVMDGRGTLEVTENPEIGTVKAAAGFAVIASTNPDAPGCIMDDALLSRFAPPVDYTTDFAIAVKFLGVKQEAAAVAKDMAKAVKAGTMYWAPTMRDLLQWKTIAAIWGERAAWMAMVTAAPVEARPDAATAIEQATGLKVQAAGWEV